MYLLILAREGFAPPSDASPAVCRSVANSTTADAPSGASHFASPRPVWKGDVQMARWSRRMFPKKCRSAGVGEVWGCGDGDGCASGEPCACAADAARQTRMKTTAARRAFVAIEMLLPITSPFTQTSVRLKTCVRLITVCDWVRPLRWRVKSVPPAVAGGLRAEQHTPARYRRRY